MRVQHLVHNFRSKNERPCVFGAKIGSRESSVDTTFDEFGEDANSFGFPSFSKIMNLTDAHVNGSLAGDGLIGGYLPVAHYVMPIEQNVPGTKWPAQEERAWDMIAVARPSANGSRENYAWFRFQQRACTKASRRGDDEVRSSCRVIGEPVFYDTYWWSNARDGRTNLTGPTTVASAAGFYSTLLRSKRWWENELDNEGVMKLELPSPVSYKLLLLLRSSETFHTRSSGHNNKRRARKHTCTMYLKRK